MPVFKLLSSLRLTVTLLGFAMVLIFVGTITQVELGIHEVQEKFFRSWLAWWDVIPGGRKFPIPIPGGTLLGILLIANLLAAHGARFKLSWNKAGMIVIHSGILLMLLGEIFTSLLGREAQMAVNEGEISIHSTFPRETADDRRDLTSAFVEIIPDGGKSQGRWLLSNAFKGGQSFEAAGRTWRMSIRQRRLYHPFSIKLLDFSHDRYLGTNVPKNFSSKIRILNPDTGENREDLIYMNHPLRYGGLTFYQAGFENNDSTSIFQVVRNPVWTLPYISCAMVGCGLLWVFSQHLIKAISRRNKTSPAP